MGARIRLFILPVVLLVAWPAIAVDNGNYVTGSTSEDIMESCSVFAISTSTNFLGGTTISWDSTCNKNISETLKSTNLGLNNQVKASNGKMEWSTTGGFLDKCGSFSFSINASNQLILNATCTDDSGVGQSATLRMDHKTKNVSGLIQWGAPS